jgi:hypothetical protein
MLCRNDTPRLQKLILVEHPCTLSCLQIATMMAS